VLHGAYAGYIGVVVTIQTDTRTLRVLVPFFGRTVAVDLSFDDVEPL